MTKIEKMRQVLSAEALAALSTQAGEYPGFVVQVDRRYYLIARSILAELRIHGVTGPNDGLTIIGSGLVGRLKAELLDSLF